MACRPWSQTTRDSPKAGSACSTTVARSNSARCASASCSVKAGLAWILLLASVCAAGEDFPAKPVRILVGFTPGGGPDLTARQLAPRLSELWKQQVIVENRPGAGGTLAAAQVARAAPD